MKNTIFNRIPAFPLLLLISLVLTASEGAAEIVEPDQPTVPGTPAETVEQQPSAEYQATVRSVIPLSPAEIADLRRRVDTNDKVVATAGHAMPRIKTRSIRVSTEPGVAPQVLHLRQGFGTSLVFLDTTGEPWPIDGYMQGNTGAFTVTQPKTADLNVLNVSPVATYSTSNVSVSLRNNPVPIILILDTKANAKRIDGVVTALVAGRGPNAATPVVGPFAPTAANNTLIAFLDGVPPKSAKKVSLSGTSGTAWRLKGRLYLRTNTVIRSPAYFAVVHGANGLRVYELPMVPILLASVDGNTVEVELEGVGYDI